MRWRLQAIDAGEAKFNCDKCSQAEKMERNCNNIKMLPAEMLCWSALPASYSKDYLKVDALGDLQFYECPLSYVGNDVWDLVSAIARQEHYGRFYFDGPLGEQPAWYIEALDIYNREVADWQSAKMREARRGS